MKVEGELCEKEGLAGVGSRTEWRISEWIGLKHMIYRSQNVISKPIILNNAVSYFKFDFFYKTPHSILPFNFPCP